MKWSSSFILNSGRVATSCHGPHPHGHNILLYVYILKYIQSETHTKVGKCRQLSQTYSILVKCRTKWAYKQLIRSMDVSSRVPFSDQTLIIQCLLAVAGHLDDRILFFFDSIQLGGQCCVAGHGVGLDVLVGEAFVIRKIFYNKLKML